MKIAVWILSGLLALFFVFAGLAKLLPSHDEMVANAEGVPVLLLRTAGVAEILGAIGLIVPALTRVRPQLTPLAAAGLVVVMIGATITNIFIGEWAIMAQTLVVGVLCAFVAWARFGPAAIAPNDAEPVTAA